MSNNHKNIYEKEDIHNIKQPDRLVLLLQNTEVILFHDEYNEPYSRIKTGKVYEIRKVRSKHFKRWLCKTYWDRYEQVPNNEAVNAALNIIEAEACYNGHEHKLHNRVAFHEGSIWVDIGDWRAVRVSESGWEIISDPPILFKRYSHQKTQVEPLRVNSEESNEILETLFSLINIKDTNQKRLFIINLNCSFIPYIPHPIDVLYGVQGTAKTTTSTIKKELIDPSELKNLRFSNNYNEFIQQASHHWHIPLDNLTTIQGWFSDTLCRIVTGEGFSKRELYTNDEDIIYSFKRCVTINGINMVPSKPDILDRCLIFEFEPIPETERIDEALFWKQFNDIKPKILGIIFSILSDAMKIYPSIELDSKPRMADFAKWGAAVAIAMGLSQEEFLHIYQENIDIQNSEALEANPISRVLVSFMQDREDWSGTATDLYHKLKELASELQFDTKNKNFPTDPNWLWRRMKEVEPNLSKIGIRIQKDDSNHSRGRLIKIINSRTDNKTTLSESNFGVRDVRRAGQQDSMDTNFLNLTDEEKDNAINEYLEVND